MQMLKSLWLGHYCSDYVSSICLATVLLTLINGVCGKTHHAYVPGWQCQDSSGSNWERVVGREHEELMHLLVEITSQHLFPSRGAYIFVQDLVMTMQESSTLLSLLQHIPKIFNEFKVWPIHGWKLFFMLPPNLLFHNSLETIITALIIQS